ncbi:MAG: AAA family ATPase [Clostridia bacterium]|jgi:hypothetical protein|nr:AAA family ATPase [Clostridiaceae bacterium]
MINSIKIKNIATYSSETETLLIPSIVNFIYGNNGAGKTTITRIIENSNDYLESSLSWDNDIEYHKLVYNRDFVKNNFNEETKLRGIYTLGEESEEVYKKIEELTLSKKTMQADIVFQKEQINSYQNELKKLKRETVDLFWENYKKKLCEPILELYRGNINSKENFFDKCIKLQYKENTMTYESIIEEYNILYKERLVEQDLIENININEISKLINSKILTTQIVENNNITLFQLINDLKNSSWVEEGLKYLNNSHNKCPFCQNQLTTEFVEDIYKLYDQKYKNLKNEFYDIKEKIIKFKNNTSVYLKEHSDIIKDSVMILDINDFLDTIEEELEKKSSDLKYVCNINKDISSIEKLHNLINSENEKIKQNNIKINDIENSKTKLISNGWDFIRNVSNKDVEKYNQKQITITHEISKILETKKQQEEKLDKVETEIHELENSITGITKSIGQINDLLKKFNFTNFSLKENEDNLTYSIIRPNGEDATKTLSEGEFSFISFLYFYNLVFGSRNKRGLQEEHILVIDDPVTSMDSNVLYIISTLIRNLIDLCIEEKRNIKQIFILSHNVYFFKEVSYSYGFTGKEKTKKKYKYFIVRKVNGLSQIQEYGYNNPIKNSYELLWDNLRKKDYNDDSNLNTMRRILEQYFHIIGNGNPNNNNKELINSFDEKDRLLVKSLLSYINDGSHTIMDGLYIVPDENLNQTAFKVFRQIFEELGHINHYKMMMQEDEES